MALGILFIFLTSGYVPELNTFLFGNVLTINKSNLLEFGIFAGILILFFSIFYPLIVTVSFDADFARTRNLPVKWIDLAMTILVAIAIVMIIRLIGIMLLMSLVSLPQMIAEKFTGRYRNLLFSSIGLSLIGGLGGLWIAYLISVPASAAIVLLLVILYLLSAAIAPALKNTKS